MPRDQRISNGVVTGYGKTYHDPLAQDAAWRSRIASEGVGVRTIDQSGSSTAISLVWCPSVKPDFSGKSAKRPSELKVIQDLGKGLASMSPRLQPPASAAAPAAVPLRDVTGRVPADFYRSESRASFRSESRVSRTSVDTAFINNENARLAAAANERKLGQTYLKVGNLVEARKHLAMAEELLNLERSDVLDQKTAKMLDEFEQSKKDTFM